MRLDNTNINMLYTVKQLLCIPAADFIGLFLYGSQNYGLDSVDSDVDAICIVHNADQPARDVKLETGIVHVYTLHHFVNLLRRSDLECHEILYSSYSIINPVYEPAINRFIDEYSNYLNYDRIKRSLRLKMEEHLNHVLWLMFPDDPSRYNKKRLYWAIRTCDQLDRIEKGESFESSLVYKLSSDFDLLKIKTIPNHLSFKDFNRIYRYLVDRYHRIPMYSNIVSSEEERCLLDFYTTLTIPKGGITS